MPKRSNQNKSRKQKDIASERVAYLFEQAKLRALERPDLAKRYVTLAKKVGMRNKVSLSKYKRLFCKSCGIYFVSGKNCRTRIHESRVVITCMSCNHIARFPLKK